MPKINLKSRIVGHGEEAPDNLTANPLNFRRHPKEQLNALKGSMKELGWIKTVIVNKRSGYVLDGHARVEEAIRQGLPSIPVTYVDLDENEEKLALAVLDPITELAYRDDETLKLLLEQANASDQDLKDFLLTLNAQEAESGLLPSADEDEVPEPPKKAITKLGDLITLGNHRLLCGDATKIEDVEKLMDGKKADMVFTDPPYRMQTEGGTNHPIGRGAVKLGDAIKHLCDFDPIAFLNTLPMAFCKNKLNAYIFCNKDLVLDYLSWAVKAGYNFNILFWKKPNAMPLDGQHRPDVEYLLFFRKSAIWNNAIKNANYSKCLEHSREAGLHPTMKPVSLMENQLLISSNINSIVVDFFGGSGSTLIACEKTNRHCYMMELDPIYCDVIIERWEKATGKKAIRP